MTELTPKEAAAVLHSLLGNTGPDAPPLPSDEFAALCTKLAKLEPIDTREAIKCPKCESGELQCVRDASVTRSVVGAIMKEIPSHSGDGAPYRYAEAELSDQDDVNTYDDYRLCCNECDETFDDEEVYDLVYPAEATPPDRSEDFMRGDC